MPLPLLTENCGTDVGPGLVKRPPFTKTAKSGAPEKDKRVKPQNRKSKHPPFPKPGKSGAPQKHGSVNQSQNQNHSQSQNQNQIEG
jgi:hypothetical protein